MKRIQFEFCSSSGGRRAQNLIRSSEHRSGNLLSRQNLYKVLDNSRAEKICALQNSYVVHNYPRESLQKTVKLGPDSKPLHSLGILKGKSIFCVKYFIVIFELKLNGFFSEDFDKKQILSNPTQLEFKNFALSLL